MAKRKRRIKKKFKILFTLVFLIFIGIGCFALSKSEIFNKKIEEVKEKLPEIKDVVPVVKEVKVIDMDSNSRNVAIMINNHSSARTYHTGLQDAHIVYEIIVEGGYTRYMALYKDKNLDKIGSIRSSRHYFLDYALENDAIYVHWGWSPEAQDDIKSLKIDNINGLSHESSYFFRDNNLNISYEHRGFTKSELINKAVNKFGYRTVSEKANLLRYSVDEIDLSKMEGTLPANEVVIPYSKIVSTSYVYDENAKAYKRYVNDVAHIDYASKKQYLVKNIITYKVSNSTLSGDVKGRQDIDNIGTGEGYFISNGYAVPITWEKKSRGAQTVYKYKDGTEIKVNDGNTFIQIQPSPQKLSIK